MALVDPLTCNRAVVQGEYVRSDVREDQDGVDLYVDVELIDVNTCEPVPNLYMDFWHANATGVYSGVVANGNGDSSVTANLVCRLTICL